jgi:LruC domain-containing protein
MKTIKIKKNERPGMLIFTLVAMIALALNSCLKSPNDIPVDETSIDNMVISPNFKFITTKNLGVTISTLDNTGSPVRNILVNVYSDLPEKGGALILSGVTDQNGLFSVDYKIPAWVDSLAIGTDAIGFVNMQKVKITSGSLNVVLGGKKQVSPAKRSAEAIFNTTSSIFKSIGTYNSLGVPNYLTNPDDVVDADFLTDLNATLPEGDNLPVSHPKYFNNANESNLHLLDPSDVFVAFIHEGTKTTNTLAFYKYRVGNAPKTPADIDTLFVIFPNTSYAGSGGGLASGNRVKIGTFPAQTMIGWALIKGGYKGTTVTTGEAIFYADKGLNPEKDVNLTKHTVFFNDIGRAKFLLAFEDIDRTSGNGSDNDFNDVVFHVTANPIVSIDPTDVPVPSYTSTDTDKDGVSDNFDAYPTDPEKAFNNFYPSKGTVGTLSFEDLWPYRGDYDLNDMVIDYNFNQITNASNQVVQIIASLTVKAIGASYHNGFGIQLPVAPNLIASVKGTDITKSIISRNTNGTEAGQSKATVIMFDDAFSLLPHPGGKEIGVNTTIGAPYVTPKTIEVVITLVSPVTLSSIGTPPYNPFIFIDQTRGREAHLIDHLPTDLADKSLLGSAQDNSDPASGRYYVTVPGQPYAIDIAGPFDHPVEKAMITKAHLKFFNWGQSGGTQYFDWYKDLKEYRNNANIYKH